MLSTAPPLLFVLVFTRVTNCMEQSKPNHAYNHAFCGWKQDACCWQNMQTYGKQRWCTQLVASQAGSE